MAVSDEKVRCVRGKLLNGIKRLPEMLHTGEVNRKGIREE